MAKDDRLYARFTLDFPDSAKIAPLSDAAFRALVEMILWSRRQLTDGFIPRRIAVSKWGGERVEALASRLLRCCLDDASACFGLLHELCSNDPENPSLTEVENGYLIHDFAEHQTTKSELASRREARVSAGRKGGLASGRSRREAKPKQVLKQTRSKTNPETETETEINKGSPSDDDLRNVGVCFAGESSSEFADGTPIPDPPPDSEPGVGRTDGPAAVVVDAAPVVPAEPSSAARTLVRQEVGNAGYPRRTVDRVAVAVDRLARQGIADDVIRESVREWDRRSGARPEWLESIAGDVVQARRARAAPAVPVRPSKVRGLAELAAKVRAEESQTHTARKELDP